MKAKKFIPVILAAITMTMAAGCSAEPEAWEYEVGVDTFMTQEMADFVEEIRPEVPIYANYLVESAAISTGVGVAYEANGVKVEMSTYMESLDKLAVTTNTGGVTSDIILKDGVYYMVSDEEKSVIYKEMTEEEKAVITESMTSSMQPAFDPAAAQYESGKTEYNGTEYLYEKITTAEVGEVMIYADTKTKDVKYIQSGGQVMELTFLEHEIDGSVFEIPADYTMTDIATMNG